MKQSYIVNEYKEVCQRSRSFFSAARAMFLFMAGNATGFFFKGEVWLASRALRGNIHGRGNLIIKCLALSYTSSQ